MREYTGLVDDFVSLILNHAGNLSPFFFSSLLGAPRARDARPTAAITNGPVAANVPGDFNENPIASSCREDALALGRWRRRIWFLVAEFDFLDDC